MNEMFQGNGLLDLQLAGIQWPCPETFFLWGHMRKGGYSREQSDFGSHIQIVMNTDMDAALWLQQDLIFLCLMLLMCLERFLFFPSLGKK